jgi:hypothetical protein
MPGPGKGCIVRSIVHGSARTTPPLRAEVPFVDDALLNDDECFDTSLRVSDRHTRHWFLCPVPPAAVHLFPDDFPDNRQGFPGRFLRRQGRICNIAHKFGHVVIDLLFRPYLTFCNSDVDRVGVVHGSGPFAYDVEYPPEPARTLPLVTRMFLSLTETPASASNLRISSR